MQEWGLKCSTLSSVRGQTYQPSNPPLHDLSVRAALTIPVHEIPINPLGTKYEYYCFKSVLV